MIVTTAVSYKSIDDFIALGIKAPRTSWKGHIYSGPLARCKKGRGGLQASQDTGNKLANQASGLATTDTGIQSGYRNAGDKLMGSMTSTGGGLSSGLSKQLANEEGQTGQAYQRTAQAGLRGIAARGMGGAPTGAAASVANTAGNQTAGAQTGEIGNAFGEQNQLNLAGANYDVGQQALYNPLNAIQAGSGAVTAASNAGIGLSKAGSTLGDIGSGLGTIASLGTSLTGMGGLKNIGSNLMNGK